MAVPDRGVWTREREQQAHVGIAGATFSPGRSQVSMTFSEFSTLNTEVEVRMKIRSYPVLDHKECRELPTRTLSPQNCAHGHCCNFRLTFLSAGNFALWRWAGCSQALRGPGGPLAVPGPLQWPGLSPAFPLLPLQLHTWSRRHFPNYRLGHNVELDTKGLLRLLKKL